MFVCDTRTDARWQNIRQFAHRHQVKSCWSLPLNSADNEAIGTVALSFMEEKSPGFSEFSVMKAAARLTAMALSRKSMERELRIQSHTDSLTGLANRAMLDLHLNLILERAAQRQDTVSVLFLDVDGFKLVYDRFGHSRGDQVLKTIADNMNNCLGGVHFLARYGGDEFVLVVESDTGTIYLDVLIDRLRQSI